MQTDWHARPGTCRVDDRCTARLPSRQRQFEQGPLMSAPARRPTRRIPAFSVSSELPAPPDSRPMRSAPSLLARRGRQPAEPRPGRHVAERVVDTPRGVPRAATGASAVSADRLQPPVRTRNPRTPLDENCAVTAPNPFASFVVGSAAMTPGPRRLGEHQRDRRPEGLAPVGFANIIDGWLTWVRLASVDGGLHAVTLA